MKQDIAFVFRFFSVFTETQKTEDKHENIKFYAWLLHCIVCCCCEWEEFYLGYIPKGIATKSNGWPSGPKCWTSNGIVT